MKLGAGHSWAPSHWAISAFPGQSGGSAAVALVAQHCGQAGVKVWASPQQEEVPWVPSQEQVLVLNADNPTPATARDKPLSAGV